MIGSEWFDIIIANLIFWPVYIYIGLLPYKALQWVINRA